MQNAPTEVDWRLVCTDSEPLDECSGMTIEDFILGSFDDECLGDAPPETDWNDWFPPPPRSTEWEMGELTDWVEIEAAKKDIYPDPDTYPLTDYFDTLETYGKTNHPTQHPCAYSGTSG